MKVLAKAHNFRPRLAAAIGAAVLLSGSFAQWSPVGAQTIPLQTSSPRASVALDGSFAITLPAFQSFVDQHGGLRTLGLPLSNDFQLLGRRVQIFERGVLQQRTDGTVQALDLLTDILPLAHADGATFPTPDPDLVAAIPALDNPTYQDQALAALDSGRLDSTAPDDLNGAPVNFGSTFRGAVTCADLPTSTCDQRAMQGAALDVWGLPTSAPTADPNNPDMIYLRFQRGIMEYSQSSGTTDAVPLGAWFKRVLIGTNVPDDLATDMAASHYLAQYSASMPLGLSRATELPATSLSSAFTAPTTITTAGTGAAAGLIGDVAATPILPGLPAFGQSGVVQQSPSVSNGLSNGLSNGAGLGQAPSGTPTPVASPSTALPGQLAFGSAATANPAGQPANGQPTVPNNPPLPAVATPSTPLGPDPCGGDEQILFAPKKPYAGTDVLIAATSATHHDVRTVRLTGPIKTGPVSERAGLNGWVWEWTISPTVDGWYEFTFFADGARACATSGFNVLPAFGAAAAPTVTATPAFQTATPIPTLTVTPTATTVPAPTLATTGAADPTSGACAGHLLRLNGANFGATQAAFNGNVLFSGGPGGATVATVFNWTTNSILLTVPTGLTAGTYQVVVTTAQGASSALNYQVGTCA